MLVQKVIMFTTELQPHFGPSAPESAPSAAPHVSRKRASRQAHASQRAQGDPRRHGSSPDSAPAPDRQVDAETWAQTRASEIRLFGPTALETDTDDQLDTAPVSETLVNLIDARARLAEISATSREGKLISNKRADKKLAKLAEDYVEAKNAFLAGELTRITEDDDTVDDEKQAAFVAMLNAREDGALMGEEAQYYLKRHHSERSRFQKTIERYNNLNTKQKIALGIGAAAVSVGIGALAGLTAAGAAAGTAIATRFGRGYFIQEAKRRREQENPALSQDKKLLHLQQNATLKGSSEDTYAYNLDHLKSSLSSGGNLLDTYKDLSTDIHDMELLYREDLEEDRAKETAQKRRAVMMAAGMVALGTTIGFIAEYGNDARGSGPDKDNTSTGAETTDTGETDSGTASADSTDGRTAEATSEPSAGGTAESTPAPTAEAQARFGEFANQRIDITIPEGSNVWDQLEAAIDQKQPFMSYGEKQRLVANMVAKLQEQNPGRDLGSVNPGESFALDLTVS